ncbi:hypothetical protein CPB84DRAFT_1521263 [Gymnopilus junonius]|uniref:F-box domain-containing protein n=1 Tax=Gymnopilus junonius TaxID=109634 RepID=A0A9P5TJ83_GYMJU|nr:hypothetical protein CPB84DRAFT_1521263 [Gymnopilus junonius]
MSKKRQRGQNVETSPASLDLDECPNPIAKNTSGLPIFPAELLLEIISYFPRPRDPGLNDTSHSRVLPVVEAEEHFAWREVIFALSQTCKNLRLIFRPYLWRRIEVWEGVVVQRFGKTWTPRLAVEKEHNLELVRQLETVTVRDPALAEYVQIVNVDVARHSDKPVLLELARCLHLFPNLRIVKLRILRNDSQSTGIPKMLDKAFSQYSYPQVSTAIISKWAYPFLSSCPNLQSINWMDITRYSSGFWKHRPYAVSRLQLCRQLKSLAFHAEDREWLADVVKGLPNLHISSCIAEVLFLFIISSLA